MKRPISPSVSYKPFLMKQLRDPKIAAAYITAAMDDHPAVFLLALRDVAESQGGIGKVAKRTRLNREHLFRMLSKTGNPRLQSLMELTAALGFRMELRPARAAKATSSSGSRR